MNRLILLFLLLCLALVSCGDDTPQPAAPSVSDTTIVGSLTVKRFDDLSVDVSWTAAQPDARAVTLSWEPADNPALRDSVEIGLDVTSTRLHGLDPKLDYTFLLTIVKESGDVYLLPGGLSHLPAPAEARFLQASSLSSSSVALQWSGSPTANASYLVTWRKSGAPDSASSATAGSGISIDSTTAVIEGLTPGEYTFHLFATAPGGTSNGISIAWAPAARFTHDAADPSVPLRMYEPASANGSGLILDPVKGGPRIAAPGTGSPAPAGSVALAISTDGVVPPLSFRIGPAYAFAGLRDDSSVDSSVYISNDLYVVESLEANFFDRSLESFFKGAGNIRGVAPNRYVELEISYQTVAGIPSA